jgi:hypothetical protein
MERTMKKNQQQLRAIFGLAARRGFDKTELEELAREICGTDRLSQLTFDAANKLIQRLGGEPVRPSADIPRRTLNYRKQRDGVVTLASPGALRLMEHLAAARGMSREGLERLCMRMLQTKRPLTARGCSAVIEALKSMNRRDRLKAAQTEPKEAA